MICIIFCEYFLKFFLYCKLVMFDRDQKIPGVIGGILLRKFCSKADPFRKSHEFLAPPSSKFDPKSDPFEKSQGFFASRLGKFVQNSILFRKSTGFLTSFLEILPKSLPQSPPPAVPNPKFWSEMGKNHYSHPIYFLNYPIYFLCCFIRFYLRRFSFMCTTKKVRQILIFYQR